jgi:hypothetical protein
VLILLPGGSALQAGVGTLCCCSRHMRRLLLHSSAQLPAHLLCWCVAVLLTLPSALPAASQPDVAGAVTCGMRQQATPSATAGGQALQPNSESTAKLHAPLARSSRAKSSAGFSCSYKAHNACPSIYDGIFSDAAPRAMHLLAAHLRTNNDQHKLISESHSQRTQ